MTRRLRRRQLYRPNTCSTGTVCAHTGFSGIDRSEAGQLGGVLLLPDGSGGAVVVELGEKEALAVGGEGSVVRAGVGLNK